MLHLLWHLLSFPLAMGFFGIGMGPSTQEKQQYGQLTADAGWATGQGESDIAQSSKFMSDILSGDPTRTAQALAPQISGMQQRAEQQKDTIAQTGNRSGGHTAKVASIDAGTRGDVTNLVGGLTTHAADSLGEMGSNLFGKGMAGTESAFGEAKTLHDQESAKINDLVSSISKTVMGAATGGMGGGLAGGIGGAIGGAANEGVTGG